MKKRGVSSKKKDRGVPGRKSKQKSKSYPKRIPNMKDKFSDLMLVDCVVPD